MRMLEEALAQSRGGARAAAGIGGAVVASAFDAPRDGILEFLFPAALALFRFFFFLD